MKTSRVFFLFNLLVLLSAAYPSLSQQPAFKFVPPPSGGPTTDGITQDPQGYMWFSTTFGLYRYDGYQYKSWFNDPLDSNSLASDLLETIWAAQDGSIWIGTNVSSSKNLSCISNINQLEAIPGRAKRYFSELL